MNAEGGTRSTPGGCVTGDLMERTKVFAMHTIGLVESLPRGRTTEVIGRQLLRSGTSVAANYRAARRARSGREFIAKMGIVEEEADESAFWFELLVETELVPAARVAALRDEASQLTAITVASIRTARRSMRDVPRSGFRVRRSP